MSPDRHRTLASVGHGKLREKASRFIVIAFPLPDEDAFKERMRIFKNEHHGARHFCYAWVLGDDGERHRANDAGEPSGTAGKPILNRIQQAGLTWCGVIVVRYFGGTLLGKAGLVKAYGEAAQMALDDAAQVEHVACEAVRLVCDHAQLEAVRNVVTGCGGEIVESAFGARCELLLSLPRGSVEQLLDEWRAQGITAVRHNAK